MNYLIPFLNGQIEIENPTIDVVGLSIGNPNIVGIDFITKKYNVSILLTTNTAKFTMILNGVQAESLNFDSQGSKIPEQVLTALNAQFGIDA